MVKRLLFTLMVSSVVASSTGCGCWGQWLCGGRPGYGAGYGYGYGHPAAAPCETGDCGTCSACTAAPAYGPAPGYRGNCFPWLRGLFTCGDGGCGPQYRSEWHNDPPAACEQCGPHGEWTGAPVGAANCTNCGTFYDLRSTGRSPSWGNRQGLVATGQGQPRLARNTTALQARRRLGIQR